MTLELFIWYGSLWTLMLGVVSLGFAVRSYRRQVNAQIFFEIAGRYHGLLQSFPVHEWTGPNPKTVPESSAELSAGVLLYLAIVHFAFVLHDLHYLSKDLWRILQAEHHRTLTTPLFVREWSTLCEVAHQIPNSQDNRPSLTVEGEAIGQQNGPVQAHIF